MDRPNIVYLHSHDTGRYIQPYGYAVPTPHLQRLAEDGVLFRQCFCAGPTCSPSRAALLTGQSPHSCGMIGLAHLGFSLTDYRRHIVHTLRQAGYRATLIGAQHVSDHPRLNRIGYDEIADIGGPPSTDRVAPAAVEFLRRRHDGPFFAAIGFQETHRVFPEASPEAARYVRPPAPIADTPETRRDMAGYVESARRFDNAVGQVLGALDAAGLADNTLVICTTDHGLAFPYMKCNLSDHGMGVMLIVRGPGGFGGGKVIDGMVSQIDLFPTVCELVGIDPPGWLEGRSLMPLVRGEAEEVNEEVFSEVTYHAAYEPMRAVRTRRWKYIRRFDDRGTPVLCNCDESASKALWTDHGWADRPVHTEELYDLVFDPNETANLAHAPDAAAVLEDMRRRLEGWMRRTDDPLLKGPVPQPVGTRVLDQDAPDPAALRDAPVKTDR
ncbi:MAG TPA: sulfatase [Phycisphaerae bacterium]|nr:sulfatase [Phycisphaerae bacterium]